MTASAFILSSSVSLGILVCCSIGFGAGIVLFFCGFRLLQRRRLILDTPFSKICSASMGMVEVNGLATGPYTITAPITAQSCYYHRTIVWEWKQLGKDKHWVKVAGECMHVPFFVDDNTGRLLVDPHGADLDLQRDFWQEFGDSSFSTNDASASNVRNFLARHGVVTSNPIKVEETCIKPRNSLFILGTVAKNPGLKPGPQPIPDDAAITRSSHRDSPSPNSISYSTNDDNDGFQIGFFSETIVMPSEPTQPQIIRLSSELGPTKTAEMTQQQRIAAALVRAGISNPAAWSAAGVTEGKASTGVQIIADPEAGAVEENGQGASAQSDSDSAENSFDRNPPVVLRKGEINRTFRISGRGQHEVARVLAWKCALMIWGGPVLAFISLYSFLRIKGVL